MAFLVSSRFIPVSTGHSLQHVDLVIHPFKSARIQTVCRAGDYAAHVILQSVRELLELPRDNFSVDSD